MVYDPAFLLTCLWTFSSYLWSWLVFWALLSALYFAFLAVSDFVLYNLLCSCSLLWYNAVLLFLTSVCAKTPRSTLLVVKPIWYYLLLQHLCHFMPSFPLSTHLKVFARRYKRSPFIYSVSTRCTIVSYKKMYFNCTTKTTYGHFHSFSAG